MLRQGVGERLAQDLRRVLPSRRSLAGKRSGVARRAQGLDEDELRLRFSPHHDRRLSSAEITRIIEAADKRTWNLVPPWQQC